MRWLLNTKLLFSSSFRVAFSSVSQPSPPIPSIKSVYKRQMPGSLIQLNSFSGKQIFTEALLEGNMECFFPLIEQFTTQYKPSTCGTTTLVMCLNALGIDPKSIWKGIWRWYSEEGLACSHADYLNEIDIEKFTHLAKRNYCSITMFYHDSMKSKLEMEKFSMECPSGQHSGTSFFKKTASFETFYDCCVASSRRDGFFLVTNTSRRSLNQTGFGHFSPIGGVHLKKKMALILDVARYKYPPYFCDIKKIYDSFEEIDTATKRSRGFCLITKSYQNYARICRETDDFLSITKVKQKIKDFQYLDSQKKGYELIKDVFLSLLKAFGEDFRFLLVHYLFELGIRLDPDQTPHHESGEGEFTIENGYGEKYLKSFKNEFEALEIRSFCKDILKEINSDSDLKRIQGLIMDFHPTLVEEIIGIILFSMPWSDNEVKRKINAGAEEIQKMIDYEKRKPGMMSISREIANLKLNLGFDGMFEG